MVKMIIKSVQRYAGVPLCVMAQPFSLPPVSAPGTHIMDWRSRDGERQSPPAEQDYLLADRRLADVADWGA